MSTVPNLSLASVNSVEMHGNPHVPTRMDPSIPRHNAANEHYHDKYAPSPSMVADDFVLNPSFGAEMPRLPAARASQPDAQERRLRALEDHILALQTQLAKQPTKQSADGSEGGSSSNPPTRRKKKEKMDAMMMALTGFRYLFVVTLVAISIFVSVQLAEQWARDGSKPSVTFSLETATALAMPTAGMIPAPYATDSNCFQPSPVRCVAYENEGTTPRDCMSWLSIVSTSQRVGGAPMVIWALDGVKATENGFFFSSILDYVEYSFAFPNTCTEPYLWVYVSGDTKIVTEAALDPNISMRAYAQSSFLIQGGQYAMVAFSMLQDVDLVGLVTNTSTLSVSALMWSDFNASLGKQATAVFRPGSFKIQTTTQRAGQTIWEFIANVGGWIGLFLGFSFVQIIDVLEALYQCWTRKKSTTEKTGDGDEPPGMSEVEDDETF